MLLVNIRVLIIKILILSIFFMPLKVYAEKAIEHWECKKSFGSWEEILVEAIILEGRTLGRIHVAGVIHTSAFQVQGFERRWDFGISPEKDAYSHAFIIRPDGDASYFDFKLDTRTKPSMFFQCRQKK